jgi:peptidoglycan/xylan/chitin deacetylase (PgdA/CDA1 family)
LLAALQGKALPLNQEAKEEKIQGSVIRGDRNKKELALIFTGDEWGEGMQQIRTTLQQENVKAAFYFTGRFYRNAAFQKEIQLLHRFGHLLGPHSDQHLLYNDWKKRDSTLVKKDSLLQDLRNNLAAMLTAGLPDELAGGWYIPPYEWWNEEIAGWLNESGVRLFSCTPGLGTPADYTYPEMGASYKTNKQIRTTLEKTMQENPAGLNGAILLIHVGTDPRRKEKLYHELRDIIQMVKQDGYRFRRIDELLSPR